MHVEFGPAATGKVIPCLAGCKGRSMWDINTSGQSEQHKGFLQAPPGSWGHHHSAKDTLGPSFGTKTFPHRVSRILDLGSARIRLPA